MTTSGPTPGEFETAVKERQRGTDDGVLVCTLASTMSSTHEAAVVGARAAGGQVRVVDTTTAAGAQALVVLAAAESARRGASLDDVEQRRARRSSRRNWSRWCRTSITSSRAGACRTSRVGPAAGSESRRCSSSVTAVRIALRPRVGRAAALDRIVARWRRDRIPGARLHVAALHAENEADATELLDRVRAEAEAEPATAFLGYVRHRHVDAHRARTCRARVAVGAESALTRNDRVDHAA